jgi:hypothetical protein
MNKKDYAGNIPDVEVRRTNMRFDDVKHSINRRKNQLDVGESIYRDEVKSSEKKASEIEKELTLLEERVHSIRKALSVLNAHLESVLSEGDRSEGEPTPDYQPSSKLGIILHSHANYLHNIEEEIYILIAKITL